MAADRNVQFFISVDVQKLLRGLGQAQQATSKFVRDVDRGFARSTGGIDKFLGGFVGPLGALVAAGTIIKAGRDVMAFNDKIARIGIDSSMSAKQMLEFKEQVFTTGNQFGLSAEQMLDLGGAALNSSKNIEFVKNNMALMSTVMAATGASGQEVGDAMGSIYEKTGIAGAELENLMDRLYTYGKGTGREAKLKEILPDIDQLLKTAKLMYGPNATSKQIGDLILLSMFTGSSAAASKMMMTMFTPTTRKHLKTLGLDIKKSLSISDVLAAENKKFGKNRGAMIANLSEMFGKKYLPLIEKLVDEQDEFNKLATENRAGQLHADAAKGADTYAASMNKIKNTFLEMSDTALSPALREISKSINEIDPQAIKALAETFAGLGQTIGTVVVGWSKLIGLIYDWTTGTSSAAIAKNKHLTEDYAAIGEEFARANKLRAEGKDREADDILSSARRHLEILHHPELVNTPGKVVTEQTGPKYQDLDRTVINVTANIDGEAIATHMTKRAFKTPKGHQLSVLGK